MNILVYLFLGFLSSLLLASSWPTYGIAWLSFVAFIPMLWGFSILSLKKTKKLFIWITILLFIYTWIIVCGFWVRHASWLGLFVSVLFASATMSLSIYCYQNFLSQKKIAPIVLITSWITIEYFHLHTDYGMPWMVLGNIFSSKTEWVQWYEYTGALGGSLWVLTANLIAFSSLKHLLKKELKKGMLRVGYFTIAISLPIAISKHLMPSHDYEKNKKITALLIQPNIDPYTEKYLFKNSDLIQRLLNDIEPYDLKEIDWIITPETYLSKGLDLNKLLFYPSINTLSSLTSLYPDLNIVIGLEAYKTFSSKNNFSKTYYNTAFHLGSHTLDSLHAYYKSKLLLGVETIPYQKLFKNFKSILLDFGGAISVRGTQKERTVFISKDTIQKMAPVICWETIFGEFVTKSIKKDANFLGVLSNDGWWSNSQGHKQLLFYNKLRAIETRRYLVRAVNTGISAVINETGIVEEKLAYNTRGVIKTSIPLLNKVTFYVKYGDYIGIVSIVTTSLLLFFKRVLKVSLQEKFFRKFASYSLMPRWRNW